MEVGSISLREEIIQLGTQLALMPRDQGTDIARNEAFIQVVEAAGREVAVVELSGLRTLRTESGDTLDVDIGDCCAVLNALLDARNYNQAPSLYDLVELMPGLRWELIPANEKIDLVKAALSKTNSQLKKAGFPSLYRVHPEGYILINDFVVIDRRFDDHTQPVVEPLNNERTEIEVEIIIEPPSVPSVATTKKVGSRIVATEIEEPPLSELEDLIGKVNDFIFELDVLDEGDIEVILQNIDLFRDLLLNISDFEFFRNNLIARTKLLIIASDLGIEKQIKALIPPAYEIITHINHPTAKDKKENQALSGRQTGSRRRLLEEDTDWRAKAQCLGADPAMFYPDEHEGSINAAKRICWDCDVSAECLEYALTYNEKFGVWGGHSERERRRVKRQRSRDSRHAG